MSKYDDMTEAQLEKLRAKNLKAINKLKAENKLAGIALVRKQQAPRVEKLKAEIAQKAGEVEAITGEKVVEVDNG